MSLNELKDLEAGNLKDIDSGSSNHGEKKNSKEYDNEQLRNALTNTMTLPPELFEQIYLNPKTEVKGDLRKTFGNPTPLGIMGFAIALLPLSIDFST